MNRERQQHGLCLRQTISSASPHICEVGCSLEALSTAKKIKSISPLIVFFAVWDSRGTGLCCIGVHAALLAETHDARSGFVVSPNALVEFWW